MQIWVDADACPAVVKDILYRAADRDKFALILVANKPLRTPPSPWIRFVLVSDARRGAGLAARARSARARRTGQRLGASCPRAGCCGRASTATALPGCCSTRGLTALDSSARWSG